MYREDGRGTRSLPLALTVVLALAVAGCESTPTQIYGSAVQSYLAQVSVNGIVATQVSGSAPAAGSGPTASSSTNAQVITGGSMQVNLEADAPFQTVYIVVDGSDGYYMANLPASMTEAPMVITVATNLPTLSFQYAFAVSGATGEVGAYGTTTVQAMEVISGDIQVSVAWSTDADVDLHVVDPLGEEIYYGNRASTTGGELDLDANAACGSSEITQENIGWRAGTAPSGTYTVRVDYWSACGEPFTEYVVTISTRPGVPVTPITPGAALRTYQGTLTGEGTNGGAGDGITIATFRF